jgi:hypothetical protein
MLDLMIDAAALLAAAALCIVKKPIAAATKIAATIPRLVWLILYLDSTYRIMVYLVSGN